MKTKYRYPGYRPFQEEDRHLFFGRDQDKTNLIELIELEQVVVLYGKSGYGKSSLLNAAVIPHLRRFKRHEIFNIRLIDPNEKGKPAHSPLELVKRHVENELKDTDFPIDKLHIPTELPSDSTAHLWYYFKIIQLSRRERQAITMVFDQFEDIREFSEDQIKEFGRALNSLLRLPMPKTVRELITQKLEEDPEFLSKEERRYLFKKVNLKVVFSLHHDRLNLLDHLKEFLPDIFKYTYELKGLTKAQLIEALVKPAALQGDFESPAFEYSKEAVDTILFSSKQRQGKKLLIEPFQLQLLGEHAEEKIIAIKKKEDKRRAKIKGEQPIPITKNFELNSKDLGNPDKIYHKHYQNSIGTLSFFKRFKARSLIENKLIIDGNRVPLPEAVIIKQHQVSTKSLEALLDKRLLRSELNTTAATSYELSHDSLIPPIQVAARQRKQRRLWILMFGLVGLLLGWGIYERNRANELESQLSNGIIINPLVIATVDPPSGPAPLDVTFTYRITDSLRNKVNSIWWEFGDGSSSSADSVLHRFDTIGTYEAKLIIIDNNDKRRMDLLTITVLPPDTIQQTADTIPKPTPIILELIADPGRGSDSLDVFFKYRIRKDSILEFKVNNVKWDFGDGEFSSLDSLTHSYTEANDYDVKLVVVDNKGLNLENLLRIDVPLKDAVISSSNDPVISPSPIEIGMDPPNGLAPLPVQFYLSDTIPQSNNEYVWKINGAEFSRASTPGYTFQTPGTYKVELEIKNNDSLKITPKVVVIDPPIDTDPIEVLPPVAIALPEQAEGVAPFEVKFQGDTSTPMNARLTYYWDFKNDSSSDLQNPRHTFDTPGPYEVILTVTDSLGRISRDTVPISVKPDSPPTARAVARINSKEINFQKSAIDNIIEGVAPFTVEFNAEKSVDDVKVERYEWDFDDGVTLSGAKRKHTFIEAKDHNVRLTVKDNRGQLDSVAVKIKVKYKRIDPIPESEIWLKKFIGIQDQNLDSIRDETNSWRKHIIPRDSLNLVVITMDDSPQYSTSGNELPHLLFFFTRGKVYKFRNIINPDSINEMRTERYSLQSLISIAKRNAKRNARNGNDSIHRKFMNPDGTVDIFRSDSENYENLAELFEQNIPKKKTINFYYTRFPYSYFSQSEQNVLDNYYLVLGQPKE